MEIFLDRLAWLGRDVGCEGEDWRVNEFSGQRQMLEIVVCQVGRTAPVLTT